MPCSSIVTSTSRGLSFDCRCTVRSAIVQLKGGRPESTPATIISTIASTMKRFQLIDTSHSA